MSLTGDIRKLLAIEAATAKEVVEQLGMQTRYDLGRVQKVIYKMVTSGVLEAEAGSKPKRWCLRPGLPPERGEKQQKIWRAVKIEGKGFTTSDIALLAGTSREYTQRYLRFLAGKGYIEAVGKKKVRKFGRLVYRLAPGKDQEEAPRYNRRREEARERSAGEAPGAAPLDPLTEFKAGMQKFIDGAREALGVAAGHCQQAHEVVEEMAGFLETLGEEKQGEDEVG